MSILLLFHAVSTQSIDNDLIDIGNSRAFRKSIKNEVSIYYTNIMCQHDIIMAYSYALSSLWF